MNNLGLMPFSPYLSLDITQRERDRASKTWSTKRHQRAREGLPKTILSLIRGVSHSWDPQFDILYFLLEALLPYICQSIAL